MYNNCKIRTLLQSFIQIAARKPVEKQPGLIGSSVDDCWRCAQPCDLPISDRYLTTSLRYAADPSRVYAGTGNSQIPRYSPFRSELSRRYRRPQRFLLDYFVIYRAAASDDRTAIWSDGSTAQQQSAQLFIDTSACLNVRGGGGGGGI